MKMKLDKGAILASMAIIMVASVLVGAGTMAYFTDVETANVGQITAGTLNMLISDSKSGPYGNNPIDLGGIDGLGPGEQFTFTVWLRNDGNLDADYVFLRFCELSETVEDFAKQLKIVNIEAWSVAAGGWEFEGEPFDAPLANSYLNYWYGWAKDTKGYLTLYDFVYVANPGGDSTKVGIAFWQPENGGSQLPADGGICGIRVTLELLRETNNDYQGAEVSFSINFVASQAGYDPPDLDDYITEDLGPLTR